MSDLLSNPSLFRTQGFVNGEWVTSASGQTFDVKNPGNGTVLALIPEFDVAEVKEVISTAQTALEDFSAVTPRARAKLLRKWHDLVQENKSDLIKLVSLENGKALPDSEAEINYAASFLEWFAEEAPRIYGDTISVQNGNNRAYTVKQPIGVCAFITPWNFPAAMVTRKAGAAIAAGCSVVLKPAKETPLTALAFAHLAELAGIPKGIFNVVTSLQNTRKIGQEFCSNKTVKKLSFTGSTNIGKVLMQQSAVTLKKLSLELGGNAPFIVFEDADLDAAVAGLIGNKFRCTGQTCVCANRVFVQDAVYDEFAAKLVAKVKEFKVGYGLEADVTHGPLVNVAAVAKVSEHVQDAVAKGAKVLLGGEALTSLGETYYAPTILTDVTTEMLCSQEETFGPVAPLIRFSDEAEVIRQANDVDVGLASYFYTKDVQRAWRVAEKIEAGMVGVNSGAISDSAFPFGGVKESGFGREGSKYGLDEYLTLKSVTVALK